MTKHDSKDEEILAGAPEGATHIDQGEYMSDYGASDWYGFTESFGWVETSPEYDTRSLADIKELVELRKKNAELENIVSVLMIADETGYVDDGGFVIGFSELTDEARNILAMRDLEQQAKGVELVLELQAYSCMNESAIMAQDIHGKKIYLEEQAKQLKGEE